MRAAGIFVAIAIALALQTTVAPSLLGYRRTVDLVLVVVVVVALSSGQVTGLLTGTVAGLAQDALSGGFLGVGGLAKTLVGFMAGVVGSQFIVSQTLLRFVIFFVATVVHDAVYLGLYVLLDPQRFAAPYSAVAWRALGNAIVGILVVQTIDLLPGLAQRRRLGRGEFARRRRYE